MLSNREQVSVHSHLVYRHDLGQTVCLALCEKSGDCSAQLLVIETAYLICATSIHLQKMALMWHFHQLSLSTVLDPS